MDDLYSPALVDDGSDSFLSQAVREIFATQKTVTEVAPLPNNHTAAELALHDAQLTHYTLLKLGQKERITSAARRLYLWHIYRYELWRNVRIPVTSPSGAPTGDYISFVRFDDYFDYITSASAPECWNITSPGALSILRNGATVLLPAADAGLIVSPDGEIYDVQDILELDEHKQQLLIAVANRALNPQKGHEATPVATIGQAAEIVISSDSRDDALVRLKEAGLMTSRGDDKFTLYTYDNGDEIWVAAKLSPLQYKSLLLALKTKAQPASSSIAELSSLFDTSNDNENLAEYLSTVQ